MRMIEVKRLIFRVCLNRPALGLCVLTFSLLLAFWPKGGAVALAAFQEGVRQPMFWLLTIVGSFIMISLGIIGEYVGRVYEEATGRPHYVVRRIFGQRKVNAPQTAPADDVHEFRDRAAIGTG